MKGRLLDELDIPLSELKGEARSVQFLSKDEGIDVKRFSCPSFPSRVLATAISLLQFALFARKDTVAFNPRITAEDSSLLVI